MDKLENKFILSIIFPWWFFPFYSFVGLLPVEPNKEFDVLKLNAFSVMRGLLILIFTSMWTAAYYSTSRGIESQSENTRKMVRKVNTICLVTGSVVIILVTQVKCWCKQFHTITQNIVDFEKFWIQKRPNLLKEKHSADRICFLMIVFYLLCLLPLQVSYLWHQYPPAVTSEVLLGICSFYFVLFEIAYLKVASTLALCFKRLNKIVKYCSSCSPDHYRNRVVSFKVSSTGTSVQ